MFRSILAICLAALAAEASAVVAVINNPASQVTNGPSVIPITVDGQFTGGVVGGHIVGEWSDVTPLAFVAPAANNGTLFRAPLSDPRVNSLLYVTIAPGVGQTNDELYLMYDYLGRTNPTFAPGEFIADVKFAIDLSGRGGSANQNITIQFRGAQPINITTAATSFFDVFIDLNNDGTSDGSASQFGIDGDVGFGPSTLSTLSHLLVELEVPLKIPAEFGPAFPPAGFPNGVYSPDPKFWGASSSKDVGDPPISSGIFTINPNGSTTASSTNAGVGLIGPAGVPEPGTVLLLGVGAAAWALRKKRLAS